MNTKALVTMLLLLLCTAIFASEDAGDAAEHERKTQELNQLAERFKAETGFIGEINPDSPLKHLTGFRGNFPDIPFSANADSVTFRQACERIVDRILPYTSANRSQLTISRISKSVFGYTTEYYQQVGGYRVESRGLILITFDEGRNRFSISNGTVELPDGVQINITRDRAISIAIDYFKDQVNPPEHKLVPYVINDLRFHNPNNMNYSLKYIIYLGDYVYYVDASTGRLDWDNAPGDFLSTFVIKGKVYNHNDPSIQPSVLSDSLSMQQIQVQVDGISQYTDDNGVVAFSSSVINDFKVNLRSSEFYITDYSDSTNVFFSDSRDEYIPNSNIFTSLIGDVCKIGSTTKLCYCSNTYIHSKSHISALRDRWNSFAVDNLKIVTNFFNPTSQANAGQISYSPPVVRIKTGLHSSLVRHELSHLFTYQVLGNNHFNTTSSQGRAMTEAFANYFSCSTVQSPYMAYPQPNGTSYDMLNLSIPAVNPMSINEEGYSNYLSGLFLASAWWGLRGNSLLPDGNQGVSGVDNLLIAGLGIVKTGIVEGTNNAYRYKPRYFYNILMSSVGGGLTPFSLNPKQIAINKAYESRGFHFTPQVESFSEGNRSRNVFSPGDQVHVKITKAPQNTAFTVYVIRHDDYTYVDGANTSTLTSCLADDFAPITGNSTDASGDWNSLVWTLPTEAGNVDGGYDIIVDFGSPQAPDNQIHYTYTAANVMDGIDGLTEPGFKVRPANNIDLVLALDCSPSMNNRSQLAKTAKQFIAQMLDGDRVGVFGFASDNSGPVIIPRFINNLCHVENTVRVNYAIDPPSAVVIELSEPILARNCHFVNDPGGEQYQNMVLEDCSIGDPLINMGVNGEYTIIWDETAKSPLINTGCPEIDGVPQHDPDGTIPDIGAVYYPHHTKKYFERTNPSGIYWMSFPVVDDRTNTNGSEYWNELGQMFSEHMQGLPDNPSNLNNISWSYDTDAATMHYQNSIWLEEDHPVTQPKGYKVKFNEGISDCSVVVDGFKADPSTTPVTWAAVDAQNHPFENWVGYFATFTQGAGDALSRYLPGSTRFRYIDYVHTIKTQSWGTCRISEEYNSTWVIDPNTYTVSEGDMLVLVLLPDAPEELYWQFPSASKPPVGKPLSTAFEYTEKLDYTSVFLEFDPQNMPAEVGLYVNGVCKGAAVVDSTLIDVCLYQDDAKDDGELEIVFYHEGKGKKAAKGWKTYNPERMVFEDTGLRTDQIGRYAYLSFNNKEGDSPVPLVTSLSQNYPNPFNPETNISFILANDMHARLDIYNIRGQKIATLFNGDMTKGKHTLQWNGTDAQGRKVASGIYFSRLTTPEGSFSQKMMLMK